MSKYYIENQCRGEYCWVEVHERGDLHYCMVYLADHPTADTCFEGSDQLKHRIQQRAFDVVFMFDDNGRLELYAEGSAELRRDLAVLFARHLLKQEVTLDPIAGAVFDLDRFKDSAFRFKIEPADRIKSMCLLSMKFMTPDTSGGRVTFSTPAQSGPSSLHNWIMRGLNAKEVPLGTLVVENVQIQATLEEGNPRPAPIRFNLTSDNGCNLKDTPEHSRIRQCLKRSEIMLNSPLDRILRRAEVRDHVITHDEVQGWPADDRGQILDLELLRSLEDADFIKCDACGKPHAFEPASQRVGGLRIRCPQIGIMRISPERCRRWDVDLNRLAELLASALGISPPIKTLKPGRLWSLGKRSVAGRTAEFFLVVGSHWPAGLDVLTRTARLRNSPAPIILCPDSLPKEPEWHQDGRALFSLTELARITEAQLVIQLESIEDLYRQIAARLDQPLVPTPVEERPQRIKSFQRANDDCTLKQIHFWARVSAGDFNKWKNGRPAVPDTSVKAIRIEKLLQLGKKSRE